MLIIIMILLFSFSLGLAVWKLIQSIWMRTLCPTIRMLSFCFCMHNNVSVWLIGETCIDKFFEWSNLKFLQSDIPPIEIFYWYFFWMVHGRELFLPFRDFFFFFLCVLEMGLSIRIKFFVSIGWDWKRWIDHCFSMLS